MSVLTLLRHGQASLGAVDYDQLSPLGVAQAAATGDYFVERGMEFDRIIHGPRRRHQQTAALVTTRLGRHCGVEREAALDEFAEPEQILAAAEILSSSPEISPHGLSFQSAAHALGKHRLRQFEAVVNSWARGRATLAGQPSNSEFVTTVSGWMLSTIVKQPPNSRILAITSAGVIAACVCRLLKLQDDQLAELMTVIGNCSVTEIVFSPTRRNLLSFNNTAHLSTLLITSI